MVEYENLPRGLKANCFYGTDGAAEAAPFQSKGKSGYHRPSEVFVDHLHPGGPVVGVVCAPDEELVGNALVVEDAVEVLVVAEALVVPAGAEDVGVMPVAVEEPWVGQVGDVGRRGVVVDVL